MLSVAVYTDIVISGAVALIVTAWMTSPCIGCYDGLSFFKLPVIAFGIFHIIFVFGSVLLYVEF